MLSIICFPKSTHNSVYSPSIKLSLNCPIRAYHLSPDEAPADNYDFLHLATQYPKDGVPFSSRACELTV